MLLSFKGLNQNLYIVYDCRISERVCPVHFQYQIILLTCDCLISNMSFQWFHILKMIEIRLILSKIDLSKVFAILISIESYTFNQHSDLNNTYIVEICLNNHWVTYNYHPNYISGFSFDLVKKKKILMWNFELTFLINWSLLNTSTYSRAMVASPLRIPFQSMLSSSSLLLNQTYLNSSSDLQCSNSQWEGNRNVFSFKRNTILALGLGA